MRSTLAETGVTSKCSATLHNLYPVRRDHGVKWSLNGGYKELKNLNCQPKLVAVYERF